MLYLRTIRDWEGLRNLPTSPPYEQSERVEAWEERGESWWVMEAKDENREESTWLLVSGEKDAEAVLYLQDETLYGRWYLDRNAFF